MLHPLIRFLAPAAARSSAYTASVSTVQKMQLPSTKPYVMECTSCV